MDGPDLYRAAQVAHLVDAVAANETDLQGHHHPGSELASVRTAEHAGHVITVRTSYEIQVDGRSFNPHVVVDNAGRVFYHGLPTRDFASVIDLVAKAIDAFPADFPVPREPDGELGGQHQHPNHEHPDHEHPVHEHPDQHGRGHGDGGQPEGVQP